MGVVGVFVPACVCLRMYTCVCDMCTCAIWITHASDGTQYHPCICPGAHIIGAYVHT